MAWIVLILIGIRDLLQKSHSILRNYPVIGHVRWLVEMIRPEIRQYLIESDSDAAPFSRDQRSLVYRRAKEAPSDHPFGTLMNIYADDYEFIQHSLTSAPVPNASGFRVTVGDADAIRAEIAIAGTQAVIQAKKGRRTPALHDRRKYRMRNQIERLFNKLKNWRRVATRYDKSKNSYLGFVSLASALLWLPFVHET